jgi:DNA-binding cell septation regulator SpoVG
MLTQSVTQVNPYKVEVLSITPVNEGNVKAYVNIHIVGLFKMDSLKIVQQPGQRAWVAMPDNAQRLPDHRPGFYEVSNELKAAIWQAALSAWGAYHG